MRLQFFLDKIWRLAFAESVIIQRIYSSQCRIDHAKDNNVGGRKFGQYRVR